MERRKEPLIQQLLYDITPESFNPLSIITTKHGYIISHGADKDLNYIFNTDFISKLHRNHLTADLEKDIRLHRQIVVRLPVSCNDLFQKPEPLLKQEFEANNDVQILSLRKYMSDRTYEKYFFITVATVQSSKLITDKGSITAFDKDIPAEKALPKFKPKNNHHYQGLSSNYNNRQGSFINYNNQGSPYNYNYQGTSSNYRNRLGSSTNYNNQGSPYNYNNQGPSSNYSNSQGSATNFNNQTIPLNNPVDTSSNTTQGSSIKYSAQTHGKALPTNST